MKRKRRSGVLNHISSLPSNYGVGDFGDQAYLFVDQLKANGFSVWQILPINPVGPGFSPYQAYSAFAGESMFISLDYLLQWGLLKKSDFDDVSNLTSQRVDFSKAKEYKDKMLRVAWENFQLMAIESFNQEFVRFNEEHDWWMSDYALYKACKDKRDGLAWNNWEEKLKFRDEETILFYTNLYQSEIEYIKFVQFMFFKQWFLLKNYANEKGISIFGDLPLYVSYDSSDVWGNQSLFLLDESGEPTLIGGVPPDYFSEDGQLWGNPVYDWDKLTQTDYHWWISRLYFNFHMFNLVRIDHFRGLESFWAVPVGSENAKHGEWLPAKGHELLAIMDERFDELPIIAEDLGIITPEVEYLRDRFNLPGMKVLQFAFASNYENVHLPHNYNGRNIVYTGTHDNDTLVGWLSAAKGDELQNINELIGSGDENGAERALEMAWSSTAELAIVPIQDILGLGSESRMNIPGTPTGNWGWCYLENQIDEKILNDFKRLNTIYNRSNG